MNKKDILISQGRRSMLHNIFAAGCYTLGLFCIYQAFVDIKNIGGYAYMGTFCIMFGLRFSISKYYRFNTANNRFRDMSAIGPIEWGTWVSYKQLNYIGVFLNAKDIYEVNLWYNETKHFNLTNFADLDQALHSAKEIADTLQLDFYDAGTDPYDGKWIG